jgi:hypothetical protein
VDIPQIPTALSSEINEINPDIHMKCKGIIIAKMFLEKNKFHTV